MSPKEKFRQQRSLTRGYNDTIGGEQMQKALDTATLEFDLVLGVALDTETAAANRWRKEGADAYRAILENLNADTPPPTPLNRGQLDHAA